MDRRTSNWKSAVGCLITFYSFLAHGQEFNIGEITQLKGTVTSLQYAAPYKKETLQKKSKLKENESILSHENSFYTAQLFDGSWLRASPNSKLSFDFNPIEKSIHVNLYSGSIKVLFSKSLNKLHLEKIIIQAADLKLESVEGKFSIIRNTLTNESSVYVEKGLVIATILNNSNQQVYLHTKEKIISVDRENEMPKPSKIDEKEMRFIHSRFYLKSM